MGAGSRRIWAGALVAAAVLVFVQVAFVTSDNFGGLDEWLDLELAGRGVVSVPYAYRPLGLLWGVPPALLAPVLGFAAFRLLFGVYALASAALLAGIMVRLLPGQAAFAVLTSSFLLAWAPTDLARLSTADGLLYQGITLGTLMAIALLVEAWHRQDVRLYAASLLAAFIAVRCYEGGIALLALAPAVLLWAGPRIPRGRTFALGFELALVLAAGFIALEMAATSRETAYQLSVMGGVSQPDQWPVRLLHQYRLHLAPLLTTPPAELATPAVPIAVAGLLGGLAIAGPDEAPLPARGTLAGLAALGLVLAGAGYGVVLLAWSPATAYRLQFLSGPGIAVFLAALAVLFGSLLAARARLVIALAAAGVVAVGTARTMSMQREWDAGSVHGRQTGMLQGLLREVPDVAPHTLFILLDEPWHWAGSFSFHHAVQYLYERRASGFVPGRIDKLYLAYAQPEGIRFEPMPILRRAWDAPPRLYAYDQVVVLRAPRDGGVEVLEDWPEELAPLPAGTRYAPRTRIVARPNPRGAILRGRGPES